MIIKPDRSIIPPQNNYYVPYVVEQTGRGERSYDIYSRLLKDRIISSAPRSMMAWRIR
jgi:ATP-dependent Clp protease protease subunit